MNSKAIKIIKRTLSWIVAVATGVLTYIGSLAVIAHYMDGDERSLFIAILPAVAVMYGALELKGRE